MQLLTVPDQDKIVNLALVQSIELDHLSRSSFITFTFSDKQTVIWSFKNPERAKEVFSRIGINYTI